MVSATSFVGVGIQGITVPLRAGMTVPTQNNFVAGDLDQLTGLKGDGSTKYISTGVLDTATAQNDYSMSSWVTDPVYLDNAYWMGSSALAHRSSSTDFVVKFSTNNNSSSQVNISPDTVDNFIGQTRTVGTEYDYLINTTSGTALKASLTPAGIGVSVFAWNTGNSKNASRIATYHYGPALNLATLEALQATLLSEVETVWNTVIYQSNFGVDTSGWSNVRGSMTANVDGIGGKDDNLEFIADAQLQSHYFRLLTSNMNTVDTYLIQCEVYVPSTNVIVDGFAIRDWTSGIAYSDYTAARNTWLQIDFISKFNVNGQPAFWANSAGGSNFTGNGTDAIYIRNFTAKIIS